MTKDTDNDYDIRDRLDKKTKKYFIKGSDITDDKIPTASFGLNLLLGGGIKRGHQSTFWGNESGGKSALWIESIGLAQKSGLKCAYIDSERTFDPAWARQLGVDTDSLDVARIRSIPDFADAGVELIRAGVDLIVVDSTSALLPDMYFDEHGVMKTFADTRQLGRFAADIGKAAKMHLSENWETAIIHISQLRSGIGTGKVPDTPTGGRELRHLDSLRIRLTSSASESYAIKESVAYGDKLIEEVVGRPVTWKVDKNKMNGKFGSGDYNLFTYATKPGVDRIGELTFYGKRFGIIEGTTWLTIYGEKFQGEKKTTAYLKSHPEVVEKLEADIYAKSIRIAV